MTESPRGSESQPPAEKLRARTHELQEAQDKLHVLRLCQLASDREVNELKAQLFKIGAKSIPSQPGVMMQQAAADEESDFESLRQTLASRLEELEIQDRLVAAADQERATHLAYIEYLKGQLAQAQLQRKAAPAASLSELYRRLRERLNRRRSA